MVSAAASQLSLCCKSSCRQCVEGNEHRCVPVKLYGSWNLNFMQLSYVMKSSFDFFPTIFKPDNILCSWATLAGGRVWPAGWSLPSKLSSPAWITGSSAVSPGLFLQPGLALPSLYFFHLCDKLAFSVSLSSHSVFTFSHAVPFAQGAAHSYLSSLPFCSILRSLLIYNLLLFQSSAQAVLILCSADTDLSSWGLCLRLTFCH